MKLGTFMTSTASNTNTKGSLHPTACQIEWKYCEMGASSLLFLSDKTRESDHLQVRSQLGR